VYRTFNKIANNLFPLILPKLPLIFCLTQWFSIGVHMEPRGPCNISGGPQDKLIHKNKAYSYTIFSIIFLRGPPRKKRREKGSMG
jgi:hypothetical protein